MVLCMLRNGVLALCVIASFILSCIKSFCLYIVCSIYDVVAFNGLVIVVFVCYLFLFIQDKIDSSNSTLLTCIRVNINIIHDMMS